jgi:hypothetical protein
VATYQSASSLTVTDEDDFEAYELISVCYCVLA